MATTGQCLCGEITYSFEGDPIATAVCHCEHCQKQGGSAFSVNVVLNVDQLTINGPIKTYEDKGDDGGDTTYVYRRFCGNCGSPIQSEVIEPPGMCVVKAGTLDDKSDITPIAQAWCVTKQPWVDLQGLHAMERES